MNIVVLSSLGNARASRCLDSLFKTIPTANFDLFLIRERAYRELTLNFALTLVGTDDDILFVGDDIEFTPGWYEALVQNYDFADILGFGMLYPGTTRIQDRGYDLVRIDKRVVLEPKDRDESQKAIVSCGLRRCDSLCGCFMFVKKHVFDLVSGFSEDGKNRWGEFIFMIQAKQRGASVAVIDHFLYHDSESTKSNPDKSLSSISYQVERGIWEDIVKHYINPKNIRSRIYCVLDESFRIRLQLTRRVLFYGIGTVTDFILSQIEFKAEKLTFCTGLPEEVGFEFNGQKIYSIEEIALTDFDWILITPLYIGRKLYCEKVLPRIPFGFGGAISIVEMKKSGKERVYCCQDVTSFVG